MKPNPLVWSEINLAHLRQNLSVIRSWLSRPDVEILAVVKADAYGHGMKVVAKTLKHEGVNFFGVANIDEAVELRGVCPKEKILVLGSFHPSQIELFLKYHIIPTVSSLEDAQLLQKKAKRPIPVHIKVDTGMGRLGIWHEEANSFFRKLSGLKKIDVQGVYTHFAAADHANLKMTHRQMDIFERIIADIKRQGFKPKYFHAANSMGLARLKRSHLNLVRPGIVLYGINPLGERGLPKGLTPILSLKARISFLKNMGVGRTVSYGASHQVKTKTRIATIPVGYSHGYRVAFSNRSRVLVGGKVCPVVGRVTMDQTLVDVGRAPSAKRWDEVVLIGNQGRASILAADLAALINTIPYEIVCSIHSRILRIYKNL